MRNKQTKYEKNSHCSYCGNPFSENLPWPRLCGNCDNTSYLNPLPVSVVLLPVDDGLLLVRRNIPPRQGSLALPGGFISVGESWQQAGARELLEETGINIAPETIQLYDVQSAPDGTVLIFGLAGQVNQTNLPPFAYNDETSETVIATSPVELAFPLHTLVANRFWNKSSRPNVPDLPLGSS